MQENGAVGRKVRSTMGVIYERGAVSRRVASCVVSRQTKRNKATENFQKGEYVSGEQTASVRVVGFGGQSSNLYSSSSQVRFQTTSPKSQTATTQQSEDQ